MQSTLGSSVELGAFGVGDEAIGPQKGKGPMRKYIPCILPLPFRVRVLLPAVYKDNGEQEGAHACYEAQFVGTHAPQHTEH